VIAVPRRLTSAFLVLQLFVAEFEFTVVPFDRIFDALESGSADAGFIIHEGRLTYARSGFEQILDLAEWWKRETRLPLPLGGNVVRKDIPPPIRRDPSEIIRKSITYGVTLRAEASWLGNLSACMSMNLLRERRPAVIHWRSLGFQNCLATRLAREISI